MLVTTVDAEEDFDWSGPFIRTAARVTSMRSQHKAHRVFERYGVVPTYLVDFPVASQDEGREPLRELLQAGPVRDRRAVASLGHAAVCRGHL